MEAWIQRWFPAIAIPEVMEQAKYLHMSYGNDRRAKFLLFDHLTKLEKMVGQEMRATTSAKGATQ